MPSAPPKPDLRKIKLEAGNHRRYEDGVCLLELAAWLAGKPTITDHPDCVSPAVGAFGRAWNDVLGDKDRQELKPYARKMLRTATTAQDEQVRAWMATDWLVRVFTPTWLEKAGLSERAKELRALPELTSSELAKAALPVIQTARKESAAAGDAARAAAGAAAWDAAGAAAWAAARDAAGAAAWAAAWDAARAAAWAAARDAARAAARDAARAAARDAAWDAARAAAGDAARAAAYGSARSAADAALAPTVKELQASAFDLLDRMIAVGKAAA